MSLSCTSRAFVIQRVPLVQYAGKEHKVLAKILKKYSVPKDFFGATAHGPIRIQCTLEHSVCIPGVNPLDPSFKYR